MGKSGKRRESRRGSGASDSHCELNIRNNACLERGLSGSTGMGGVGMGAMPCDQDIV